MAQRDKEPKSEGRIQATLDSRRLEGLNAKDFEKVIKVWARSENHVPPEIETAFLNRLRDNRIPLVCYPSVFFEAKKTLGWSPIQEACLGHLRGRLEDVVTVFNLAVKVNRWEPPVHDTKRIGPVTAPTFRVKVKFRDIELGVVQAPSIKEAKQKAIFGLISVLVGFPEPTW